MSLLGAGLRSGALAVPVAALSFLFVVTARFFAPPSVSSGRLGLVLFVPALLAGTAATLYSVVPEPLDVVVGSASAGTLIGAGWLVRRSDSVVREQGP